MSFRIVASSMLGDVGRGVGHLLGKGVLFGIPLSVDAERSITQPIATDMRRDKDLWCLRGIAVPADLDGDDIGLAVCSTEISLEAGILSLLERLEVGKGELHFPDLKNPSNVGHTHSFL